MNDRIDPPTNPNSHLNNGIFLRQKLANINIPSYIFLSHYPKEHYQSPCASVFHLFIGESRIADLLGHIDLNVENKDFESRLRHYLLHKEAHLLFNGFQSLLLPNSTIALEEAAARQIPVTIYWHETAWNLRFLAQRSPDAFRHVRRILPAAQVTNWVPTSQCMHAVSTLFGFPFETFRIVYEVVDLQRFQPKPNEKPIDTRPIVVAGAGLPDARKGIDTFSYIAHEVRARSDRPVVFQWYAATQNRTTNRGIPYPDAIEWMGHHANFEEKMRNIDIFLLTSRDDPSPLVVFEALACGHPAYCFSSTGFVEMLPGEFIASHPDEMVAKLLSTISSFKPAPFRFRSLALNYGPEKFLERAFSNNRTAYCNIPTFDEAFFDEYADNEGEQLALQRAQLITKMASVLRRERAISFEINTMKFDLKEAKATNKKLLEEIKEVKKIAYTAFKGLKREINERPRIKPRKFPFFWRKVEQQRRMKVCVVGNSPAVLDTMGGPAIDKCDVVIRINNFQTNNYEQFVGSKTTYAVISPACKPNNELSALDHRNIIVFGANMRNDVNSIRNRIGADNGCKIRALRRNILSPELYVDRQRLLMGVDLGRDIWPSTGLTAIQWAVDCFGRNNDILFHGFSFYEENEKELTRYFGATNKADGKHDFGLERLRLQRMVKAGELRPLVPSDLT